MLNREGLWRRMGGEGLWSLPWALAAACAVPWLLPEGWDGRCGAWSVAGGWLLVLAAAPLAWRRRWAWIPLLLTLVWGTVGALGRQARWESGLPTGFQELRGRLVSPWRVEGRFRASTLRLDGPGPLRGIEVPLRLPAQGSLPPPAGTPVTLRGELRPVEAAPPFLPERPLWRARCGGAPRSLRVPSARLLQVTGPMGRSPLLAFRVAVQRRFEALPLPEGPARDLLGALLLGLPPAREEAFSAFAESGTLHTLVVSGLQVTLVMRILEALGRGAALGGRFGGLGAAAGGGLLYGALVGYTAPVWRGLAMGLAWAAGRNSGWKLPPLLSLHGALLLWLFLHPAAGVEPGFLLAWFALLGLFWGVEPLAGLLHPFLGRAAPALAQVAAPWLSTFPLLALFHGGVPLWGIPANLILVPAMLPLLVLGLVLLVLPSAALAGVLGGGLAWIARTLAPAFARVAPLATGILGPWLLLLAGWILLAQRHAAFRRTRALVGGLGLGSLALLAFRGTGRPPATLCLEAIDVGQGDALLLRVPEGEATVVDTGPDPRGARRMVRVLSRRGVREPVHLLLTHPHLDHAGGWATLARLWPLASTGHPPPPEGSRAWVPFAPAGEPAVPTPLLRGTAWTRGAAECSVRWPPRALDVRDPNMASAVLRVRWKDRELWLMGDALALQETDLLALGEPGAGSRARLLKAGHHGSRSASSPGFVGALAPDLALICAGARNAFDHPHPEALAALEAGGARALVSGPEHGVRVEAVAGGWRVETGRGERFYLPARIPDA